MCEMCNFATIFKSIKYEAHNSFILRYHCGNFYAEWL